MSRGPGRIERAIADLFRNNPTSAFIIEEVAEAAYPGLNRVEKKHRVAVLRSVRRAASTCGWWVWSTSTPGSRLVCLNPLDFRSYATGWLRSETSWHAQTPEEIADMLDDPGAYFSHWSNWQPGGAWHYHVLINRARAAGDEPEVSRLQAELKFTVLNRMTK